MKVHLREGLGTVCGIGRHPTMSRFTSEVKECTCLKCLKIRRLELVKKLSATLKGAHGQRYHN